MDLTQLRERIDQIDRQVAALLTERMGISEEVAACKKQTTCRSTIPSGKSR